MNYDLPPELLVEADGPVRIVTLNRPDALNALNQTLHDAVHHVWAQIAQDDDARAVVLTGAGRAFSAGGDIPWFKRNAEDFWYRRRGGRNASALVDEMLRFHLPVVAAINGPAVGLGCSVAVLCDIVLIADTAYMADPHVQVGLVAADGGAMSWPLMMSLLKAKEYLLTGDRIPADQAVALGLANRVVPAAELRDEALRLAHRLASLPPQAVQDTKRALNLHAQLAAQTVGPFAFAAQLSSFETEEVLQAVDRFESRATRSGAEQPGSAS
jgi:enoyl-CoA hydratase